MARRCSRRPDSRAERRRSSVPTEHRSSRRRASPVRPRRLRLPTERRPGRRRREERHPEALRRAAALRDFSRDGSCSGVCAAAARNLYPSIDGPIPNAARGGWVMKMVWGLVLAAGSILAAAAVQVAPNGAQSVAPNGAQSVAPNGAQSVAPDDTLSRRFIQTTTGTVKSYSPGHQIVLAAADGTDVTMKLDEGARVDASIAEGQTVTVAWLVDSLDRRRVTSIALATPEPAQGAASSSPPSKAYASS